MTTIDGKKLAVAIKRYREENDLTLQEMAAKIFFCLCFLHMINQVEKKKWILGR
jgi:hypothetical protein